MVTPIERATIKWVSSCISMDAVTTANKAIDSVAERDRSIANKAKESPKDGCTENGIFRMRPI